MMFIQDKKNNNEDQEIARNIFEFRSKINR